MEKYSLWNNEDEMIFSCDDNAIFNTVIEVNYPLGNFVNVYDVPEWVTVVFENTYTEIKAPDVTEPDATEPEVTEPEVTEPQPTVPADTEPTIPAPSQDATGIEESEDSGVADVPQTGFLSAIDTGLWCLLVIIMVAGFLGAILINGKKK